MTPEILQSALAHALALVVAAHRGRADPAPRICSSRSTTWSGRVHGDHARWTSNIALQNARQLGLTGAELARELLRSLGDLPGVSGVEVTGPGFLGFDFRPVQLIAAALTLVPPGRYRRTDGFVESTAVPTVPEASVRSCAPTATGTETSEIRDIQLAHAAGCRVARNARSAGLCGFGLSGPVDLGPASLPLLVLLAEHRSRLARTTMEGRDRSELANLLGELSRELTAFVAFTEAIPPMHRRDTDVHRARRTVITASTHALHYGLDLLGAPAPERM